MTKYEFRAVPCPQRAQRHRDLPKGADAFCETLTSAINELAVAGWDYIRTEAITVKTRGLLRRRSEERMFLVFRREIRPLVEPRPVLDVTKDVERVRARRVKSQPAVEFVRGGGRRITVADAPANLDTPSEVAAVTAAE